MLSVASVISYNANGRQTEANSEQSKGRSSMDEYRQDPCTQYTEINPISQGLIDRIRDGELAAVEDLFRTLQTRINLLTKHHLGHEATHAQTWDAVSVVVQAIQCGDLRNPEALGALARAAALSQMETLPRAKPQQDDNSADRRSQSHTLGVDTMVELLRGFSPQQRKAVTRFYVDGQSVEQICSEMQIEPKDFRSLKSRMKAKFAELEKPRRQARPDGCSEWRTPLDAIVPEAGYSQP